MDVTIVKALIGRTIILPKVPEVALIHDIGWYRWVILVSNIMVTRHIIDRSPDTLHYLVSHTGG